MPLLLLLLVVGIRASGIRIRRDDPRNGCRWRAGAVVGKLVVGLGVLVRRRRHKGDRAGHADRDRRKPAARVGVCDRRRRQDEVAGLALRATAVVAAAVATSRRRGLVAGRGARVHVADVAVGEAAARWAVLEGHGRRWAGGSNGHAEQRMDLVGVREQGWGGGWTLAVTDGPPLTVPALAVRRALTASALTAGPPLTVRALTGPPLTVPPLTAPALTAGPPLTVRALTAPPLTVPPLTAPALATGPPLTVRALTARPLTTRALPTPPLPTPGTSRPALTAPPIPSRPCRNPRRNHQRIINRANIVHDHGYYKCSKACRNRKYSQPS